MSCHVPQSMAIGTVGCQHNIVLTLPFIQHPRTKPAGRASSHKLTAGGVAKSLECGVQPLGLPAPESFRGTVEYIPYSAKSSSQSDWEPPGVRQVALG